VAGINVGKLKLSLDCDTNNKLEKLTEKKKEKEWKMEEQDRREREQK
jgi:hypothetical protein